MADGPGAMLTGRTMLGVGWSVATRLSNRLIDFVTLLVLARLLVPADFGLTALASTLVSVVEIVLEVALIQVLTRLPQIDKSHLDTAFTLGMIRGGLFAVVVLASAWPFATLYHDPRLIPLIAALSIGPIARGLYSPGMVKFIRELCFREQFQVQLAGKVVAALACLGVVFAGGGYWAIAVNSIATAAGITLFSYVAAPYKPALSLLHAKEFFGFLGWFSLGQFASALNWQADRVLLGYYTSKTDLGKYTVTSDLATLPTQSLIGPAMQPVMAAFAKIHADQQRVRGAFLKAARFTMLLAMPASLLISTTADLWINLLFAREWHSAIPYLRWCAMTVLLHAYYQPLYSLAVAGNRVRIHFTLNALELALRVVFLPIGLYLGSILGVIAARGAIALVMFVATVFTARQLALVGVIEQLRNLWQVFVACALLTCAVLLVRHALAPLGLPSWLELGLSGISGGSVYLACLLASGVRFGELRSLRR
jgi:O-antigen/teichoic acid export membrane protein